MEYPDEEQILQGVEVGKLNVEVEEVPINNMDIKNGFAPFDVSQKIDAILGVEMNTDGKFDNTPLFETGDKLLQDVPVIDTEEKIKMILDF